MFSDAKQNIFINPIFSIAIIMKIIIFGASGDLAARKLFPALSKVYDGSFKIIAFARSDLKNTFSSRLKSFYDYTDDFPEQIEYIQGQYDDLSPLKNVLDENSILYFSVPPKIYNILLNELNNYSFHSVAIEKPYGISAESFEEIASHTLKNIYLIDHYLLKPLMIAIPTLYSKNKKIFECLSKKTVKKIKCYFLETLLSEGREYFDKTGIVKDVVQNHLIEVFAGILSITNGFDGVEKNRSFFLKDLQIPEQDYFFGQYETYKEDFLQESKCETFVALKCFNRSEKWRNTPIIMVAGKGLSRKVTEIIFEIKKDGFEFFKDFIKKEDGSKLHINEMKLVFNITPGNEIFLEVKFVEKIEKIVIFTNYQIEAIKSECYGNLRSYEIIFDSLIRKRYFPSVCCDEAMTLWKLFDHINKVDKNIFYYENGTEMPNEVQEFVESDII